MKSIPFYPLIVILLIGLGSYLGCDPNDVVTSVTPASHTTSSTVVHATSLPPRTTNTILMGSFNIQRLGPSKMRDETTMNRLAEIVRQFDILAIQEITDSSGQVLPALIQRVNQNGAQYEFAISPRVGREASGYYEQYAFVFDSQRIMGGQQYCYLVQDQQDYLHREPFVGRFATRVNRPFTFTLINVHTDPDELNTELDALARLLIEIRNYESPEDDIILLGDLNEKPEKLRGLQQIPGLTAVLNVPTNTRQNRSLDNFLLDPRMTAEITGRAGTVDLQQMFGINLDEALRLSDHLPIWAEFANSEGTARPPAQTASQTTIFQR
ncbi:MAG: endonuclease/exonuclease/phosphatase family protein [Pirellulaceae bacterium]|nr:endonuclease/exonuclease/phosphatase family protein [Pirellulaceae bacterium]